MDLFSFADIYLKASLEEDDEEDDWDMILSYEQKQIIEKLLKVFPNLDRSGLTNLLLNDIDDYESKNKPKTWEQFKEIENLRTGNG